MIDDGTYIREGIKMKYCEKPFDFVHVDWNGNVYLCAWTYIKIGNLLENDLETIWSGEAANMLRQSIMDGTYRYCFKHTCPKCNNNTLPDLDKKEFEKATIPLPYPKRFELSYDYICNHKCPSCRHKIFKPDGDYDKKMRLIAERLLPYLNKADFIDLNGNGDMFASPYTMELLSMLKPENPDIRFNFETNGVLFDEEHWKRIEYIGKYNISVTVTPNSYEHSTYKYLTGGVDNYNKLLSSLKYISELRDKQIINSLSISIVVQDTNYRELPEFARRSIEEFKADRVVVKPIYPWFELREEEYWFKDVLNPSHPYFKEYQEVLSHPYLKNPKVFMWGADNIHKDRKHPYIKYRSYYEFCMDMLNSNVTKKDISSIINKVGKCAIYGAGTMGKFLYEFIDDDAKKNIEFFIDRYTREREFGGKTIKRLFGTDLSQIDTIIVTSVKDFDDIKNDIRGEKYVGKIMSMHDLISEERNE